MVISDDKDHRFRFQILVPVIKICLGSCRMIFDLDLALALTAKYED